MFRGVIHSHTKFLLITIYTTLKEMAKSEKDEKFYDIFDGKNIEEVPSEEEEEKKIQEAINVISNNKDFIEYQQKFNKHDEQQRIQKLKDLVNNIKGDESIEDILAKLNNEIYSSSPNHQQQQHGGVDHGQIAGIALMIFVLIYKLYYDTPSNTQNGNNTEAARIAEKAREIRRRKRQGIQTPNSGQYGFGGRKRTKKNRKSKSKSKRKQARRKSNRRRR